MRKLFNKIPIRTAKDWMIAGIFMALIIYCITMLFKNNINKFMLSFIPPKLSRMNVPESYGNLMITVFIMTVTTIFVQTMKNKSKKLCALSATIGIVIFFTIFGVFKYHCLFIVNTAFTREAEYGVISSYSSLENKHIRLNSGDERLKKLISLVNSLEELPNEEQKKLGKEMKNRDFELSAWISFPTAFGYHYSLVFDTVDDKIIFNNGYYGNNFHYFKDNGFINYANELLESVDSN